MLVCVSLCIPAHETAGAARTRLSLRPLVHSEGGNRRKARTHRAARMRTHILSLFDIRICISEKPVTSGVPDGGHGAIAPLRPYDSRLLQRDREPAEIRIGHHPALPPAQFHHPPLLLGHHNPSP